MLSTPSAPRPAPIRPGTRVRLPDGTIAYASPDQGIGRPFCGTYRTTQGNRTDIGWRREQLEVVEARAELPSLDRCPGCGRPAHASETDDAGYHPGCRPSSEKVTQRIPRVEANWRAAAVRLRPVHMPAALDAKFARAVTQALPVFGGDELAAGAR